ncbi:MAG TPA: hypothetical protein VFU46_02900 [Gemmatimonadales bacterium]|nr:hypothetical protein [Gemmatimonadales bacterium]
MAAHGELREGDRLGEGGLERLLETEARLERRLAAAEADARVLVRRAEEAAAALAARYGDDLEQASTALAARIAAERDAVVARLRADALGRAARFRALPDERMEALAQLVVRRVVEDPREEGA